MGIFVSGYKEFDTALDAITAATDEGARNIVTKGSLIIAGKAKDQYRQRPGGSMRVSQNPPWNPKFKSHIGRVYYDGAAPYQAVPPRPTIRSGATRSSIRTLAVKALDAGVWMSLTGPTTPYAVFPEFGTTHIHTPFPAMGNGLKAAEDEIQSLAEEEWAKAAGSTD